MIKVTKFGGSSLASASQFKKVADIILADETRRYVVPSAPGKRFPEDVKVTDMLYACYKAAVKGQDFEKKFDEIKERYNSIIKDLGIELDLTEVFEKIRLSLLHSTGRDYIASRGEYLNAMVLAKYLGFSFIDAKKVPRPTNSIILSLGFLVLDAKYVAIPKPPSFSPTSFNLPD